MAAYAESGLALADRSEDLSSSEFEDEEEGQDRGGEEHIKQELSEIPLGELQKLREKLGTKKFDTALRAHADGKTSKQRKFKRENKNRPREMTSHRPVSRFRQVVPVKKQEARDPRFGERSGKFHHDMFKKAYAFLEDVKEKEKSIVKREAHKTRDPERKSQLNRLLQKMESQKEAERRAEEKRALEREHKKAERQLQKEGKKPFYLKKSVQKRLALAEKYKQLKKTGKLEKFLSKKRKRNAKRDRRQLPFKRKQ